MFYTKNNIIDLEFPKKVIRTADETDEQFEQRNLEFSKLRRQYAKAYAKAKLNLETSEEKEIRRRKARKETGSLEERKVYLEKERIRSIARQEEQKLYRQNNSDLIKAKRKVYYDSKKENPEFIQKHRMRKRKEHENRKTVDVQYITKRALRTSLKNNINYYLNGWKTNSIKDLIGCTTEEFIKHIEDQFVKGMSWTDRNFHLDHIRPCSSFDLTDDKQMKECFHYTNYQPLWPEENLEKNAKVNWERKCLTPSQDPDKLDSQPRSVVERIKE